MANLTLYLEPEDVPQRRQLDATVLQDVLNERIRQDRKFGPQSHPNGTGGRGTDALVRIAREECNQAFAEGQGTWKHILDEEFCEALAESDPAKLRKELIQIAAVAVAWAGDLDAKQAGLNLGPTEEDRAHHRALAQAELKEGMANG